jgi:hypothetical protein
VKAKLSSSRGDRFAILRGKVVPTLTLGASLSLAAVGHAFAQAAASSPTGGLGAQMNLISSEAINSGSTAFGMACYLAATVCFGLGVWALWQSRQPQNRETGHIGKGVAGLVLCGLFATAGRPGHGPVRHRRRLNRVRPAGPLALRPGRPNRPKEQPLNVNHADVPEYELCPVYFGANVCSVLH